MANIKQKSIIKLSPHPTLVEDLQNQIIKHGGLKITGFGMFKLKRTKGSKNALNPYSQKRQKFSPKTKVSFRPVKSFKDKMQKWTK